MIVAHEVINLGDDRPQFATMAKQAREAIGAKQMTVLADRGYFKSEEILECEQAGIQTLVPKPHTSNNQAMDLFDKDDFGYISAKDEFRCSAGQRAIWRFTAAEPRRCWYLRCHPADSRAVLIRSGK
jgi:hypothetical protein